MKIKIAILTLFILIAAQVGYAAELQPTSTNSNLSAAFWYFTCHPEEAKPTKNLRSFTTLRIITNAITTDLRNSRKSGASSLDWLASEFQAQQAFARSA